MRVDCICKKLKQKDTHTVKINLRSEIDLRISSLLEISMLYK
jgi:hypothetical protein